MFFALFGKLPAKMHWRKKEKIKKDSGCVEFSPDRLFQVGVYGFGNVLLEIRENPETFRLLENTEKNGIELEGLMVAVYSTVRTEDVRLPLKDQTVLEKNGLVFAAAFLKEDTLVLVLQKNLEEEKVIGLIRPALNRKDAIEQTRALEKMYREVILNET